MRQSVMMYIMWIPVLSVSQFKKIVRSIVISDTVILSVSNTETWFFGMYDVDYKTDKNIQRNEGSLCHVHT